MRDFSKGAFLPACMEADPEGTEWVQTRHPTNAATPLALSKRKENTCVAGKGGDAEGAWRDKERERPQLSGVLQ